MNPQQIKQALQIALDKFAIAVSFDSANIAVAASTLQQDIQSIVNQI